MRLTRDELARLDAATAAGQTPSLPPPLPGLGETPATAATLVVYRRARLGRS